MVHDYSNGNLCSTLGRHLVHDFEATQIRQGTGVHCAPRPVVAWALNYDQYLLDDTVGRDDLGTIYGVDRRGLVDLLLLWRFPQSTEVPENPRRGRDKSHFPKLRDCGYRCR